MTPQQILTALRARKWIAMLMLFISLASTIAVTQYLPQRWTATTSVLVDSKGPDPISGIFLPAQMLPGYMATQVDIIRSRTVALKVVDALRMQESQDSQQRWREATDARGSLKVWLADLLLRSLDVKPARESNVVDISISGGDPQRAAEAANAFAQAYIDTNLELKVEPARQQAKWFSERALALRQDLEGSASKLAAYQQQKGIVSLDERLDTENARLEQFNAQLSQATAQTADAQTRERLARDVVTSGIAPDSIPEVVANPLVQSLKSELTRKEGRLMEISVQLGTNHPQFKAVAAEVDSNREKVRLEMSRVIASLDNNARIAQRRESELRTRVVNQKTRVLALKKERDELSALMREAENAQKAFDVTTQRYTQTTLESQATQTNLAILSPAVAPLYPSSPNWRINIVLSLLLGTFLGVGVALLLEMTNQRLRTEEDVARLLALPLLASVPFARLPRAPRPLMLAHRPAKTA
jgi:protein tyrosine kinase modulator